MTSTRTGQVPGVALERPHWADGLLVAGLDEVGRGAWAGPVTFAAVVMPPERRLRGLRDSKLLTPARRDALDRRIRVHALGIGLGQADNQEIDALGLAAALRLAARRAIAALPLAADVVLIDGNVDLLADAGLPTIRHTVVRGDARCASIAAASVVAKVDRDTQMRQAASRRPGYAFAANKGYPTPAHRAALVRLGPCDLHRRSWAPFHATPTPGVR